MFMQRFTQLNVLVLWPPVRSRAVDLSVLPAWHALVLLLDVVTARQLRLDLIAVIAKSTRPGASKLPLNY
jgi:hypothetical protein